jgi:hypothetical protein
MTGKSVRCRCGSDVDVPSLTESSQQAQTEVREATRTRGTCSDCGRKIAWWNRDLTTGLCAKCARTKAKKLRDSGESKQNLALKIAFVVLSVIVGGLPAYMRHHNRAKIWNLRDAQRQKLEQPPWGDPRNPAVRWPNAAPAAPDVDQGDASINAADDAESLTLWPTPPPSALDPVPPSMDGIVGYDEKGNPIRIDDHVRSPSKSPDHSLQGPKIPEVRNAAPVDVPEEAIEQIKARDEQGSR